MSIVTDKVLMKLKRRKATEPVGFVNELFVYENIGNDLKESLLMLLNKIKDQYKEPDFMGMANITSFWKRKGPKEKRNETKQKQKVNKNKTNE